jgi:hypothetical protein
MSRKMMADCFDMVLIDNNTASTYLLLGMYYKLENNVERSKFYIHNVELAVDQWKKSNQLGDLMIEDDPNCFRMSFLDILLTSLTVNDCCRDNMVLFLKIIIYLNSIIDRCNELDNYGTSYQQETQFDVFLQPYLGLIKEDIDNRSNTRFPIDVRIVDLIIQNLLKSEDANVMTVNRRNVLLFAEAAKIQLLQQSGDRTSKIIRNAADHITANSEYASLCMLQVVNAYPVLVAMQVHLVCLDETPDFQDRVQLVGFLKQDVKALQDMIHSNKQIEVDIGYIVHNVAQSIIKEEEILRRTLETEVYLPTETFQEDYLDQCTDSIMEYDKIMFL